MGGSCHSLSLRLLLCTPHNTGQPLALGPLRRHSPKCRVPTLVATTMVAAARLLLSLLRSHCSDWRPAAAVRRKPGRSWEDR